MTLWLGKLGLTLYAIDRDHGRGFGLFYVSVPEVREIGIGFQMPVGRRVLGTSVTWRGDSTR